MLVCMSTGENENHSYKGRSLSSPSFPSLSAVTNSGYTIFLLTIWLQLLPSPPTATHVIYESGPHCIYEGLKRYYTVFGVISSLGATDTDAGAIEIGG